MKKFLIKLLIYVALLSSITLCINEIYKHQGNEYDKFVAGVPDGIQICNFGSSHGVNSFDYNDVSKDYVCFNFAMTGQTLPYDYRVLKHYADKLNDNAVVFIVISYFSLFGPNGPKEKEFASRNRRYYKFLPPELIQEYDTKTDFYVNYLPALTDEKLLSIINHVLSFFRRPSKTSTVHAYSQERAEGDAMNVYTRQVAVYVDPQGNRMLNHEAIAALYDIIALCKDKGARPILVITPYTYEYVDITRKYDPKFYADFYGLIDKIVQDTGIEYYDYSERFTRDYAMFSDNDHLNSEGGKIFTRTILREVLGIETD